MKSGALLVPRWSLRDRAGKLDMLEISGVETGPNMREAA